jgi:hypothetical protein
MSDKNENYNVSQCFTEGRIFKMRVLKNSIRGALKYSFFFKKKCCYTEGGYYFVTKKIREQYNL